MRKNIWCQWAECWMFLLEEAGGQKSELLVKYEWEWLEEVVGRNRSSLFLFSPPGLTQLSGWAGKTSFSWDLSLSIWVWYSTWQQHVKEITFTLFLYLSVLLYEGNFSLLYFYRQRRVNIKDVVLSLFSFYQNIDISQSSVKVGMS